MNFENLSIAEMDVADLDEIVMIQSDALNHWSSYMFLEEIRSPISHCFVIREKEEKESKAVGYICFRNIQGESELLNIGVHPQYRNRGIGKKLMAFYIEFCKEKEITSCFLEVSVSNQAAIHLYQNFSFQPFGKREKFYRGEYDALLMVKKI
jgi:[ribosomal protein S18]-alanine N-acetyltransferase